ncbi:MAG TPA: hypothetical protein VL947_13530, partial [Cytophagales bacterium]|nr:hypothetical protein [Cytophagales bacterium]
QVRAKYPQSQIALLSSPIVHKEHLLLENCLEAVKQQVEAQDPKHTVALYFFEPIQASGCTGHPSVEDHAKLAEALHPFFKQLVGK